MAGQKLIVDGYNVVYTDDRLRRVAIRDLETARSQLVERFRSYVASRRVRVTIVFDGRGGIVEASSVVPGKLQVVYSASGQSADELILSTLEESGNPRQFIVVTSDMADIGRSARKMGCEVIGSKRFLDRMGEDRVSPSDGEEPGVDMGNTEYWLRMFDEDPDGDG